MPDAISRLGVAQFVKTVYAARADTAKLCVGRGKREEMIDRQEYTLFLFLTGRNTLFF